MTSPRISLLHYEPSFSDVSDKLREDNAMPCPCRATSVIVERQATEDRSRNEVEWSENILCGGLNWPPDNLSGGRQLIKWWPPENYSSAAT